jgi:hypothetical protein
MIDHESENIWKETISWLRWRWSYLCNRPWRILRRRGYHSLDNLLTDGGEVISLKRRSLFTPPGSFLLLISVNGWAEDKDLVRLEESSKLKDPITSSAIELVTNRLEAYCPPAPWLYTHKGWQKTRQMSNSVHECVESISALLTQHNTNLQNSCLRFCPSRDMEYHEKLPFWS